MGRRDTHVTHMYASEPNFGGVSDKLKLQMRASIRQNRYDIDSLLHELSVRYWHT
eukprot:COSAG01_NODE_3700_length_5780_cov_207.494631_2_plen_55_part_00